MGLKEGSILSLLVITSLSITFVSSCFQAKVFLLSFKNFTRSCSISSSIEDSMRTLTLESSRFKGSSFIFFSFASITSRTLCFSFYAFHGNVENFVED